MTFRTPTVVAGLAALLLSACGEKRVPDAAPERPSAVTPTAPAELEALLPDAAGAIRALTDEGRADLARYLDEEFCHCGCPHTLSGCLRGHATCEHAKRQGWIAARLAAGGVPGPELRRMVTDYYASFESSKRTRLGVDDFGPPLGNEDAPITVVEYSDFTCPYCRMIHQPLERWIEARADRVKLYYKPFPIPSHRYALEAAQSAEWARDQGRFWEMHDALFAIAGAPEPDRLADLAAGLGLDGDDLLAAIREDRHGAKIRAAMTEARGAGLEGTPTLWFQGRRLTIADFSDEMLDRTLQDEEEWQKHGGWAKD